MATKAKRHIHKYHRVNASYIKLWACAFPDCNHHMPKHLEDMVIGKGSFCWECDAPIILDSNNMKEDKPRCDNCLGINKTIDLIDIIAGKIAK